MFLRMVGEYGPWFVHVCSTSLLKTLWEKEELLIRSNFSFSHSVFYPFGELSAIFIKFEIVICKLFHVGSVENFSYGKGLRSLTFTEAQKIVYCLSDKHEGLKLFLGPLLTLTIKKKKHELMLSLHI